LLSEDIKKFFQIKPYPNRGWDTRQRFVDILGARRVTNEKKLSRFISSSRVVICTYPQTTFAESIVSGKPTVLFYPEQYWETIPEMEGLINLLKKVGIIFVDYRLLANHLNEVWKNPIKWWGSEEVLEARNEMNLKLFDHNTDSIKEWARFINQNDSNI